MGSLSRKESRQSGPSSEGNGAVPRTPCILYCNCTYAKVVPEEVKRDVLVALSSSGVAFDAVPDLCDMSARNDPALERIAGSGSLKIAACYERAVRWLFHAAKSPLPAEGVEILNMREESAEAVVQKLLGRPQNDETDA